MFCSTFVQGLAVTSVLPVTASGGSGVLLTVSSSRSLSSPLRLLWMKALALLDLDILILASLAFWVWEEKGQRIKQGGFEITEDD